MYERLLDKATSPTFDDLIAYSGEASTLWLELDKHLKVNPSVKSSIRFPYGNTYGWSVKYSLKSKHICDAFAENGAFSLHFRISDACIDLVYKNLTDYAKEVCDHKYPCKDGGWLTYRVLLPAQLNDAKKLLATKMEPKA